MTESPGGEAQAPRVIEVERVNPEITEYLTMKRTRRQSRVKEDTTTDASEEGCKQEITKTGKRRKGKLDKGQGEKLMIEQLRTKIEKLKEQLEEERNYEEDPPDYSLLPTKENLPSVKELREHIRFEPHFAIEGIMVDSANRISKIATCSKNIRGVGA